MVPEHVLQASTIASSGAFASMLASNEDASDFSELASWMKLASWTKEESISVSWRRTRPDVSLQACARTAPRTAPSSERAAELRLPDALFGALDLRIEPGNQSTPKDRPREPRGQTPRRA